MIATYFVLTLCVMLITGTQLLVTHSMVPSIVSI